MAIIAEDYVSFETAKLLKEKGFNIPTWTHYEDNNEIVFGDNYNWNNSPLGQISAPTLQMAIKWLRIEHNIHIEPHIVRTARSYGYMPNYVDLKNLTPNLPFNGFDFNNPDKYVCSTPGKACEVTMLYCLENLI